MFQIISVYRTEVVHSAMLFLHLTWIKIKYLYMTYVTFYIKEDQLHRIRFC